MRLIDKSYYDYDYQKLEVVKVALVEETRKSDEELYSALRRLGWRGDKPTSDIEQMQNKMREGIKD